VLQEGFTQLQVATGEDHLILLTLRLRHDLAGRRHDGRAADHVETILEAALAAAATHNPFW
jgi:hypothetical protein